MAYIAEAPPLTVLGTLVNLVPLLLFGARYGLDLTGYRPAWLVLVPTGLIFVLSLVVGIPLGVAVLAQTFRGVYRAGALRRWAIIYYITLLPVLWLAFQILL